MRVEWIVSISSFLTFLVIRLADHLRKRRRRGLFRSSKADVRDDPEFIEMCAFAGIDPVMLAVQCRVDELLMRPGSSKMKPKEWVHEARQKGLFGFSYFYDYDNEPSRSVRNDFIESAAIAIAGIRVGDTQGYFTLSQLSSKESN